MPKFIAGQSGNPTGKPRGTLNKRSQLAKLLEPYAETLIEKAVELALAGDTNALRLLIERLIPKAKEEFVSIVVPELCSEQRGASSIMLDEVLKSLSGQVITLEEAKILIAILQNNHSEANPAHLAQLVEMRRLVQEYRREY